MKKIQLLNGYIAKLLNRKKQFNNITIKQSKLGFTLIEVLVVISIIGTLASLATFALGSGRNKGNDTKRKADLKAIQTAAVSYYQDHSQFPPDPVTYPGSAFSSDVDAGTGWVPGISAYINTLPKDPLQSGILNLLAGLIKQQAVHTTQFLASLFGSPNTKNNQQGQVAGVATIAFDAMASAASASLANSLTFSHTTGSGTNSILLVGVAAFPTSTVSNITYNGFALTKIIGNPSVNAARVELWYLKAPTTGAHNVVVTMADSNGNLAAGSVSYSGVDQTTPLGTPSTAEGNSLALTTTTASTLTSDLVVDVAAVRVNNFVLGSLNNDLSQTYRYVQTAATQQVKIGASDKAGTGGSMAMNWTTNNSAPWRINSVALKAATVPNSPPTNGTVTGPACANNDNLTKYRFTATYNDPDGYADILYAYVLINNNQPYDTTTAPVGAFSAVLNNAANDIGIRDDANTTWNWAAGGINGNSYANLDRVTSTHSGAGTTLTVNWDITFKSAWQPESANVWIKVTDISGAATTYLSATPVAIPCPSSDPTITSCSITPTNPTVGQNVTISATIKNNRATAISTQVPDSGFGYLEAQTFSSLGYAPVSGKFRVGIDNSTGPSPGSYPWRWGFGPPSTTTLAAGASTTITGTITMGTIGTKTLSIGLVEESIAWRDTGKCPTTVTVTSASPGLNGYWNLNETSGTIAADSSGNANNGTTFNTTWTTGKYNNGVLFDSTSDYINLPSATANFSGTFTVELWAQWNNLSGIQALVSKVQDSNNIAFILFKNSDNKIYLNTKLAGGQSSSTANPTVVAAGTWYHIAAVMDASNNVTLYVNALSPTTTVMANRNDLGNLRIGESLDPFWNAINGTVDEVRIYNTARTQAQITADMNSGAITPTVTTTAATAITSTGATLNGTANPNGQTTTGWFRYATASPGTCDDTFGTRIPASGGAALGSGSTVVNYPAQAISSLTASTTYYFCAIASSSSTGFGSVLWFATSAPTSTADIKANGSNGPITVNIGDSVSIAWTSSNTTSCTVTGGAGGSGTSGSFAWTATTNTSFSISCTGATASDSVTVNVGSVSITTCENKKNIYCYIINTDRSSFVIWAQLDNANDPDLYNKPNAICKLTPPASTFFNYCVESSSL